MSQTIYQWVPRTYYIFCNRTSGVRYLGQTVQDISTYLGSGPKWINHCKKHGGYTKQNIELEWLFYFEDEELAQLFLDEFEDLHPNYYHKETYEWANQVPENTDDNPFYGPYLQQRRIADGTHHLLSGEIQSKTQQRLVSEGIHQFQGPDMNKKSWAVPSVRQARSSGIKIGINKYYETHDSHLKDVPRTEEDKQSISAGTKAAMDDPELRKHLSQKATERKKWQNEICRFSCMKCHNNFTNPNFRNHTNKCYSR